VKLRAILFGAIAATLGGCARFESKPLSAAQVATEFQARSLDSPALKEFVETSMHQTFEIWPPKEWNFSTLTLVAFYYHPSLAVARAQWAVAAAGVRTAGGQPNPVLAVTPGYSSNPAQGISPWFPMVSFDVPIETAGKRRKRITHAGYVSESARLNIATAAWQVRSSVRSGLLDYCVAQRRAAFLQKQVAAMEQIAELLGQKAEVGALAGSEVAPSRVALFKARLDLADAQRQIAEARVNLAEATGVSVNSFQDSNFSFDFDREPTGVKNLTSMEIQRQALLSRSDILRALAEYAADESTLRLEIAKQYPDVHLNPGYQFDQGEHKWSLGISVDLPLLNRNQGPIAEAEARRKETAARFNELQAKVLAEIDRATAVFRVTEANSDALQLLSDDQAKQRVSVEQKFRVGAAERLDLLSAEVESNATELALLDGQLKLQRSIGALENGVQRPLSGAVSSAELSLERSEIPINKADRE